MVAGYVFGSVLLVSLLSVLAALPFFLKEEISRSVLLSLLGLSAGSLLGGTFFHFIPKISSEGFTIQSGMFLLAGFLIFFILEKFVHWNHDEDLEPGHGHAYHLAPVNLLGDGVHNFIDGMVIAGGYLSGTAIGVAATLSVIMHEIPQEIADFGVLLYAGWEKTTALFFNLFSALTAVVGAGAGLLIATRIDGFVSFVLPFAAGNFIYIAASNLIPEFMQRNLLSETIIQILTICIGVVLMLAIRLVN